MVLAKPFTIQIVSFSKIHPLHCFKLAFFNHTSKTLLYLTNAILKKAKSFTSFKNFLVEALLFNRKRAAIAKIEARKIVFITEGYK